MEMAVTAWLCSLPMPIIMLFLGFIFFKYPPDVINSGYGYRTKLSMSSPEAWMFAQRHMGHTWLRVGTVMLLATVLALLLFGATETVLVVLSVIQLATMIISVYFTHLALKKHLKGE